jgi:hypothetical protein
MHLQLRAAVRRANRYNTERERKTRMAGARVTPKTALQRHRRASPDGQFFDLWFLPALSRELTRVHASASGTLARTTFRVPGWKGALRSRALARGLGRWLRSLVQRVARGHLHLGNERFSAISSRAWAIRRSREELVYRRLSKQRCSNSSPKQACAHGVNWFGSLWSNRRISSNRGRLPENNFLFRDLFLDVFVLLLRGGRCESVFESPDRFAESFPQLR